MGASKRKAKKEDAQPAAGTLYYGDNLDVLELHIKDESVDLVYLDPPFQSGRDYNVLFAEYSGERSAAQIKAFEDTWKWDLGAEAAYRKVVESGGSVADVLHAMRTFLGENDMMSYLAMMAPRLIELHRVLKSTGSIYLHCDPTASHYLKMLMDAVFGPARFQNEIVWYYKGAGISPTRWARRHDILLWYSKSNDFYFDPDPVRDEYADSTKKRFSHFIGNKRGGADYGEQALNPKGKHPDDVWQIPILAPSAKARLGYPTQKPEPLLERVILSSSREGDVVLDPFCGCGTTVAVAHRLKRRWIGIDITHLAIGLVKYRLLTGLGARPKQDYLVIGEPTDLAGAEALARDDPYQFQWWALGQVGARRTDQKKGPDQGVDGRIHFHDEPAGGKTKSIVISVKAGKLKATDIRDLRGVVARESASIGLFISMNEPTSQMRREAATAGFYSSPWGTKHPCIQLLTIADLLAGGGVDYPPPTQVNVTLKKAPRPKTAKKQYELYPQGEENDTAPEPEEEQD